ncbi:UNVERIFIED_CONTAM: hypothetical protein RMT77_013541 [Armadillidium vulgare]
MKSTTIISCLALILTQNVPLRALEDPKAEPQTSNEDYYRKLGSGGYYQGRAIGALGNAAGGFPNTKDLQAKGFLIGDVGGNIGVNTGFSNIALEDPKAEPQTSNEDYYRKLGSGGYYQGRAIGALGNAAFGPVSTKDLQAQGFLIGHIPEVPETTSGVIFRALGRDLGGALINVLGSGVGGIIATEKYPERGCTVRQISGIVSTVFSDMKIHLQECRTNNDCRGIAKERCGVLPEVPNVGSVCLFS